MRYYKNNVLLQEVLQLKSLWHFNNLQINLIRLILTTTVVVRLSGHTEQIAQGIHIRSQSENRRD